MSVPRRSKFGAFVFVDNGLISLAGVLLRESHAKGIVNFRDGGAALGGVGDVFLGLGGGGPHGIEGKEPERPGREGGLGAAGEVSLPTILFDVIVVERDLSDSVTSLTPSCTSSNDVVDIRGAVGNGDLLIVAMPSFVIVLSIVPPSNSLEAKSGSMVLERGD